MTTATADLTAIRSLFEPTPGSVYLDTASYGLPPRPSVEALQAAIRGWQTGHVRWLDDFDRKGEDCRAAFAALIGAATEEIALVPTVSVAVATVAAALGPDDEIVIPDEEFASVLFPILAVAEERGVTVRRVGFTEVAEAIRSQTTLVAFSLVQSQWGSMADLSAICEAASRNGARVLVDATHALPFVDVAAELPRIDYLACHGYKHLLLPRGVAFFYVRDGGWANLPAIHANWRTVAPPPPPASTGGDPTFDTPKWAAGSYGGDLLLPEDASRFDVSLDWLAWVGAHPTLELLVEWKRSGALDVPLALTAELAERLGLPRPGSTILGVPVADAAAAQATLAKSGIRVSAPAGRLRLSTHVYTTPADIAFAADQIAPLMDRTSAS